MSQTTLKVIKLELTLKPKIKLLTNEIDIGEKSRSSTVCMQILIHFFIRRVKSGLPGFFVALNPTDTDLMADFTNDLIGSELSVWQLSDGFKDNQIKGKVFAKSVSLSKNSVAVFTFVPK